MTHHEKGNGPKPSNSGAAHKFTHLQSSADRPDHATRLREIDDTLEAVWTGLVSGTLRLDRLRQMSPHAGAIYLAGFDAGIAAQVERVKQAEWTSNRLWAKAFPDENAARVQARLDKAIDAMPAGVLEHSPEYFALALAGSIGGAA
ncbi:hypothetical protein [Agrococcus sp. ProA11]|uniref:hypothetical protein n=1 Tax=Agrococcus chionoecetis TaxID=3153752 RepID=UPI00325FF121